MKAKTKKLVLEKFKISKLKSSIVIKGGNDTYVDENTVPVTNAETCSVTAPTKGTLRPSSECPLG